MKFALIIAALALAGCHSHTGRWASCAHAMKTSCHNFTPIAAVP